MTKYPIGNLSPHELLCVRQNASVEEIKENYKKLARATHPDRNNRCSGKLFMLITNAKCKLLKLPAGGSSLMDDKEKTDKSDSCPRQDSNNKNKNDKNDSKNNDKNERKNERNKNNDNQSKIEDFENLTPHELLCVRQNATIEEINENYKKLARVTHPDKNRQCSDKLYKFITNAKDELIGRHGGSGMMNMNQTALKQLCDELKNGHNLSLIICAFENGICMNMMCYKCIKRLEHIDQLCYCAEAAERCHHRKCCHNCISNG